MARWKNALLDLSLRNRLINFTERSRLSLTVPHGRLGRLEDILHDDKAVSLRASDELSEIDRQRGVRTGRDLSDDRRAELLDTQRSVFADITDAAYTTRLRGLAYKARTITEETGANNLYLALGSLVWELDGRPLRSPLILVPVVLKAASRGGRYRITLDDAGMSTPNYCLLEKLRQVHGLTIPGLAEPPQDGAGIDLDAAFHATRDALAARSLSYRVEETADLAILQFAKFRLWKDLDENWRTFTANPLVAHLVRSPTEVFTDPVDEPAGANLDELAERCPVPADSSQLRAVAEATAGRTFVLEGPPGTGKSQTITNLLSRAVADGKRVLFVAEKRAALDVVQRRLDEVGMGPLSLDLHDKGSRPAAVRDQIKQALEYEVPVDHPGLAARLDDLQSARRRLTRYAYKLHEPNAARLSLYSARDSELAIDGDVTEMPVPESFVGASSRDDVEAFRQLFRTLPDVADPARARPDHPWAFVDAAGADAPSVEHVLAAARQLDAAITALPHGTVLDGPLRTARTPADLRVLAEVMRDGWPPALLDEVRTEGWIDAANRAVQQVSEFAATAHPGMETVTPDVLDLPLAEIDEAARAAAGSGFLGRKKRLVAERDRLAPVLRQGVQVRPKKLPELTAALAAVANGVQELARQVGSVTGSPRHPGGTRSPTTVSGCSSTASRGCGGRRRSSIPIRLITTAPASSTRCVTCSRGAVMPIRNRWPTWRRRATRLSAPAGSPRRRWPIGRARPGWSRPGSAAAAAATSTTMSSARCGTGCGWSPISNRCAAPTSPRPGTAYCAASSTSTNPCGHSSSGSRGHRCASEAAPPASTPSTRRWTRRVCSGSSPPPPRCASTFEPRWPRRGCGRVPSTRPPRVDRSGSCAGSSPASGAG
ncbi:MAG: DUF4011 domain-containing protein [Pseudonocardiaceae bacterium]|nr:DUF4011 domain-containing protein [Pseudonocardiaceae bacterium]